MPDNWSNWERSSKYVYLLSPRSKNFGKKNNENAKSMIYRQRPWVFINFHCRTYILLSYLTIKWKYIWFLYKLSSMIIQSLYKYYQLSVADASTRYFYESIWVNHSELLIPVQLYNFLTAHWDSSSVDGENYCLSESYLVLNNRLMQRLILWLLLHSPNTPCII